jgi:hypothetical protein
LNIILERISGVINKIETKSSKLETKVKLSVKYTIWLIGWK